MNIGSVWMYGNKTELRIKLSIVGINFRTTCIINIYLVVVVAIKETKMI